MEIPIRYSREISKMCLDKYVWTSGKRLGQSLEHLGLLQEFLENSYHNKQHIQIKER